MTTPPTTETWLNRVDALLAKAESTEFPDEAEALMAKAQELMARHAIDDAMLAAAGRRTGDEITSELVVVTAPYATAKAALLGAVARANHCQCIMSSAGGGSQRCVVLGYSSDLASVRTLFASLSVHAVRAMLATPVPAHDTPRRFRRSFLLAFSFRIGTRLEEAAAAARASAEADGATGVGLVLADRSAAVVDAVKQAYPNLRTARFTSSSSAGIASGRAAADRAGLGQQGLGGQGRALPS
ncbi:DUF2786 domain-containing protein [Aquihabitans sp. G128]|uniref:DUF2786 domain-containing protein n=1 Tax=Aquihabitans sp. G128 TaxID=2849779 RepID=UPI001C22EA93|nr:DUF2786 domain-containing protein [Aquihabitans sp. G128]QXC59881.1 DUF2786 domain-containing protein [Aquihabitans sp. G128]